MTKLDLFQAIDDAKVVLKDENKIYSQGVEDTIEVLLRYFNYYKEYKDRSDFNVSK